MGLLSKTVDPDNSFTMNAATVSMWFRIPSSTFNAASDSRIHIPLLMWGEQILDPAEFFMGPSWIGIGGDPFSASYSKLLVQIQTSNLASGSGLGLAGDVQQTFGNHHITDGDRQGYPGPIAADVWHHLFLSWQLTATETASFGSGVSGLSTMYCVLDGFDKSSTNLPAICPATFDSGDAPTGGPNNHCSIAAFTASTGSENSSSLGVTKISNSPIAIPGRLTDIENTDCGPGAENQKVQIGPMQIFGGRMLTNDHIGLFLNGLRPADQMAAQNALGVAPHVRFSKGADFASGKNTGSLGNFSKVGTVATFSGTIGL